MNVLLIFFAIPLATIILSSILETLLNCPFKVAGIFFSIFIVVAFALGGSAELIVAAIVYTLISFVAALITKIFICNNESSCSCSNTNTCSTSSFASASTLNSNTNLESNTSLITNTNSELNLNTGTESNINSFSNTSCRRYRY